jgi:iron complex transport system ATP-binding protein
MNIELFHVGFSRPERGSVLEDISFAIGQGRALAILGANGVGKTTLLSLCGGRLGPQTGKIHIDGMELRDLPPRVLAKKVAFLPQIERLPFNYRVLDFVLMGRTPHLTPLSLPGEIDVKAAKAALVELGIGNLERRSAAEISGGEFQLVRIARCIAQEAELLLLDEPTSLLDPANARRVAVELRSLVEKGRTILFSTHDFALTRGLAQEAILLRSGRVLSYDIPDRVLAPELLASAYGIEFRNIELPTAFTV